MKMIARKEAVTNRENVEPKKCRTMPPKITTAIATGSGVSEEGISVRRVDCGRSSFIDICITTVEDND
jgi:hypothetical protein